MLAKQTNKQELICFTAGCELQYVFYNGGQFQMTTHELQVLVPQQLLGFLSALQVFA